MWYPRSSSRRATRRPVASPGFASNATRVGDANARSRRPRRRSPARSSAVIARSVSSSTRSPVARPRFRASGESSQRIRAAVQDRDAVAEEVRLLHRVRRQDDRELRLVRLAARRTCPRSRAGSGDPGPSSARRERARAASAARRARSRAAAACRRRGAARSGCAAPRGRPA